MLLKLVYIYIPKQRKGRNSKQKPKKNTSHIRNSHDNSACEVLPLFSRRSYRDVPKSSGRISDVIGSLGCKYKFRFRYILFYIYHIYQVIQCVIMFNPDPWRSWKTIPKRSRWRNYQKFIYVYNMMYIYIHIFTSFTFINRERLTVIEKIHGMYIYILLSIDPLLTLPYAAICASHLFWP